MPAAAPPEPVIDNRAIRSWAIVVGINAYPDTAKQNTLNGAVADAADFADWVLHGDGGAVDPERCYFWTHPAPVRPMKAIANQMAKAPAWTDGAAAVHPNPSSSPGVREIFQTAYAMALEAKLAAVQEDVLTRCYIFLAGHGVQGRVIGNEKEFQTCFLAGDYQGSGVVSGLLPTKDLRLGLLTHGFNEAFLFLDCCRLNVQKYNSLVMPLNDRPADAGRFMARG